MAGGNSGGMWSARPKTRPPARFRHKVSEVSVLPNENERLMARIDALSRGARTNWLGLMAYLAFFGVTLLGVEDADFFIESRQTDLPLLGVSIPTLYFFGVAPVLAAALYAYLHFHLMTLWHVLAEAPERIDGKPLGERTFPWLVNDLALSARPDRPVWRQPLRWLSNFVTVLLVWAAGPLVIWFAWWRSMPAHNLAMTTLIGGCLLLTVFLALTGRRTFTRLLKTRTTDTERTKTSAPREAPRTIRLGWLRTLFLGLAVALVLVIGTGRSKWEGVYDTACNVANASIDWVEAQGLTLFDADILENGQVRREAQKVQEDWVSGAFARLNLVSADLAEVELVPRPADWRDHDEARRLFRVTWCERQGLPLDVCGPFDPDATEAVWLRDQRRNAWCEEELRNAFPAQQPDRDTQPAEPTEPEEMPQDCEAMFAGLDSGLADAWTVERGVQLAALPALDLRGRDLRKARMDRAFLPAADLRDARLEGANLRNARLEGADLKGARLEGVDSWGARLEGANLEDARLEGADLSLSRLEGAYLSSTTLQYAIAQGADFGGARGLTQDQLATVIGDEDTRLPADAKTGAPLHVWSCWMPSDEANATVSRLTKKTLFARLFRVILDFPEKLDLTAAFLHILYICPPGTEPQPVGTYVPAE
jgi:uncharacterized protein YjbI with pentapeptide repeats